MQSDMNIVQIPVNKIKTGKNSRMDIKEHDLLALMTSIKEVGLLQPIGLSKSGNGYEIVYGNRRFLAMTKLGYSKVPAIIKDNETERDNNLQNLTENLQRRNISLTETGRYMELLRKDGLTMAEIAVRLGLQASYVRSCLLAYQEVPKKYREDLEVRTMSGGGVTPGKISISTASKIIHVGKKLSLDAKQTELLFGAAKDPDGFHPDNIEKYGIALKQGDKDFLTSVKRTRRLKIQFWMDESDIEKLEKKYVLNGDYRSLNGFFIDVINGQRSEKLKVKG